VEPLRSPAIEETAMPSENDVWPLILQRERQRTTLALAARKGATEHPGGWTGPDEWQAVPAAGGWNAGRPMAVRWYPSLADALSALPDVPVKPTGPIALIDQLLAEYDTPTEGMESELIRLARQAVLWRLRNMLEGR
jgi:hypothetical protein